MTDLQAAIETARANRETHRHWLEWRRLGHRDNPMAGDAHDHAQAIAEYDVLVAVLERCQAEHPQP